MNEGWFHDPFGVHQLRWFSAGTPTDLVRDEDVEAYEEPPQAGWDGELTPHLPAPTEDELGGGDLLRAGPEAGDTGTYDAKAATDAALDRSAASGLGFD